MRNRWVSVVLTIFFLWLIPEVAYADNCGSLGDCFGTLRAAVAATVGLAIFGTVLSIGLDFIPVVGTAKGLIQAITGKDLITGEELTVWERALGIIPFAGAATGALKAGKIAGELIELNKGLHSIESMTSLGKHAEEAAVGLVKDVPKGFSRSEGDMLKAEAKEASASGAVKGTGNLVFKKAADYFDYIGHIGKQTDLTSEQKLAKIHEAYSSLEIKGDVTAVSDTKFLKPEGFGANGKMIVDWPKDMGFTKDSIQSISRSNPLPEQWDRIGGKTGENFTTLPSDGVPFNYDQRAIPYLENPSARHIGTFNNNSYFDAIDAIKNGDLDELNKIVATNGKNPVSRFDFDDFMAHYRDFQNNVSNVVENVDTTYGLKGTAAPWFSSSSGKVLMNGGAEQIVTPLNAEMLEKIGVIPNY